MKYLEKSQIRPPQHHGFAGLELRGLPLLFGGPVSLSMILLIIRQTPVLLFQYHGSVERGMPCRRRAPALLMALVSPMPVRPATISDRQSGREKEGDKVQAS